MRIKTLKFFFITFFILLGIFLLYLQIIKGPLYKELSYRNSIRLLNINASRGIIYDRYDKEVAHNVLSFGVFIVPQETSDLDAEIKKLSGILEVPESLLRRNYKRNYRAPFAPCEVARDVPKRKAILVEEMRLDMPGVLVKEIPLRRYPYKDSLAHAVGYIGEINKGELELLKSYGYAVKDMIGKEGIERVADSALRGRSGGMQIQVDNRGRRVKVLSSKKPESGRDIYLTIDAEFQSLVSKMMAGKRGAAIFMDPRTGEVLSMVSTPSYDPNGPLSSVLNDVDSPFLNRAVMAQYPPGSLFKIILAITGLDSEKITSSSTFICRGRLEIGKDEFSCWKRDGHGPMDLDRAITESCNVYFYNVGLLVGVEKINEYARHFGFGKKTGIELFGEKEGFVPSRPWKSKEKKEPWYAGDTANLSIGQGYLLATPLQVVRVIASVANGGRLVTPHVLKRIGDSDIEGHREMRLKVREQDIKKVKLAMGKVVREGTGMLAWSDSVSISGKTGTSQRGLGFKTHAWFGGFAPSENPEICFVIFLESGGSGGDMPALIAKKAVEYWFKQRTKIRLDRFVR